MKKIMVMLFIMVMGALASPLFADPPTFGKSFSTNYNDIIQLNVNGKNAGAAHAVVSALSKVDILHRDNLMPGLTKIGDNKKMKISGSKTNVTLANAATVVCYPRIQSGV